MKKILCFLSSATISGTSMPCIVANQIIEKKSPPSLEELAATINIGNIEVNDERHILECLRTFNHSIFSQPEFIANFEFTSITRTRAIGHLRRSVNIGENRIIPRLPSFIVNFTASNYTLASFIPNQNLGHLQNNYEYTILERLQELNPEIVASELALRILRITTTGATIEIINHTRNNISQSEFDVSFTTNNFVLASLLYNSELGELINNTQGAILAAILRENSNLTFNNINHIDVTNNNSAIVYGQLRSIPRQITFLNDDITYSSISVWRPATNSERSQSAYDHVFLILLMFPLELENKNQFMLQVSQMIVGVMKKLAKQCQKKMSWWVILSMNHFFQIKQ